MMDQYNDLWISGHATPGYPGAHKTRHFAPVYYIQRPDHSVVGSKRALLETYDNLSHRLLLLEAVIKNLSCNEGDKQLLREVILAVYNAGFDDGHASTKYLQRWALYLFDIN